MTTDLPITLRKNDLAVFTPASQRPPKCGDLGGMCTQPDPNVVASAAKLPGLHFVETMSLIFVNSFRVPTKFVPLSLYICSGGLRRDTNLFTAAQQAAVVKHVAILRGLLLSRSKQKPLNMPSNVGSVLRL